MTTDLPTLRPLAASRATLRAAALCCFAFATSPPLSAQSLEEREIDGPSIALGETALFPSLQLGVVRTDNVYRAAENEIEASSAIIAPRLLWVADRRLLTIRGTYDGEYAQSEEQVLEYADHRLGLVLSATPNKRLSAEGSLVYGRGHQMPGTSLTRELGTDFDEPVTFDELRFGARGRFGADRARGNIAFGLGIIDRSYTNLKSVTDGFDFLSIEPYGQFSVRLSGDTRALVELRFTEVDFDEDDRDRQDVSVLGGLSFLVTGRSSGELKAGVTRSDYAREGRSDENTLVVEGRIDYAAREYSRLRLTLIRELDNTAGARIDSASGEAVSDLARIDWVYDWSERFSQTTFASYARTTRGCPQLGDSNGRLGLELSLRIRRWLELGLNGEVIQRTGEGCDGVDDELADAIDHDTSLVGLFLRARL